MTITASMVKELRERTGAGMMECKKALVEAGGDMEAAITAMRKSGQAKAAKRAGRIAAEGIILIALSDDHKTACMVEINCETDFVARDENFRRFADQVVQRGLATRSDSAESLLAASFEEGNAKTIEEARAELVAKIGENVQLRRAVCITSEGTIGAYSHGDRIGVITALDKSETDLATDIAMHIAAMNPQAIDSDNVSPDLIAKERDIFSSQAKESGKPDNIIEKMVEGRIAKFLKEICLVDQPFVKNPDQTIAQLLKAGNAAVTNFIRFEVGEGIEKEVVDFAEEVHAQIKGE